MRVLRAIQRLQIILLGWTACQHRHAHFHRLAQVQAQALPDLLDGKSLCIAIIFRGRLVLSLQYWLWRAQAWQHRPSWEPQEGDAGLTLQMAQALNALSEAVRLDDAQLLRNCTLLQVVGDALL